MNKLNVKVVIFDWSGTLSDDTLPCYNAAMRLYDKFGMPKVNFDEWKKTTDVNAVTFFEKQGIKEDPDKLFKIFSEYYFESLDKFKLFDDTRDILSFLKSSGKSISIVSAHPEVHLQNEVKEFGVSGFMSSIFGGVKDKAEKLSELIKQLNVKPSEVAYIGDTIHDIRDAKRAGVFSIAISRGYHTEGQLKKEKPDFIINSLDELKNIIK